VDARESFSQHERAIDTGVHPGDPDSGRLAERGDGAQWQNVLKQMLDNTQAGLEVDNHALLREQVPLLTRFVGPESAELFIAQRARWFEQTWKLDHADATWEILLSHFPAGPRAAHAHYRRGIYLRNHASRLEEAIGHFCTAIEAASQNELRQAALLALAESYIAGGELQSACAALERFLGDAPAGDTPGTFRARRYLRTLNAQLDRNETTVIDSSSDDQFLFCQADVTSNAWSEPKESIVDEHRNTTIVQSPP